MSKKQKKGERLVWIDMEMTGLDPHACVVLEIATIVTDADLEIVAEGPEFVVHATEAELAAMVPVVQKMHKKSGLTERVRASVTTVGEAESKTLAFVRKHCPTKGLHPICGNSIGTDRRFIAEYMPRLDKHLSYRSIDVSSIKELAKRWHSDAYAQRPEKKKGHRALMDIRESIEELRYWRKAVFAPSKD